MITEKERFDIITSAAQEGIDNALETTKGTHIDTLIVKLIAQVSSMKAARRALEKYDELRALKSVDDGK